MTFRYAHEFRSRIEAREYAAALREQGIRSFTLHPARHVYRVVPR
jgi:hypothetical protein